MTGTKQQKENLSLGLTAYGPISDCKKYAYYWWWLYTCFAGSGGRP
jgi:hypothetical protein